MAERVQSVEVIVTPADEERRAKIDAYLVEFSQHRGRSIASIRELWSERAAIREYLGGLRHRRNAELHAVSDTLEYIAAQERARP